MPTSKDFTYTHALFNLFRNVMNYSNLWKIDWIQFNCISENHCKNSANLKPGAHTHQTTARPVHVSHACAQSYHAGSGSHGQLVRPYWGLTSWHNRRSMNGKTRVSKTLYCWGDSFKHQLHTTHLVAVEWEPHVSSPTTCAGKVDHESLWIVCQEIKARSTQQLTSWPVPHACVQPYHADSGSHRQLFRPYGISSLWHNRRVKERGKPVSLFYRG